jgi:hypothetical protein
MRFAPAGRSADRATLPLPDKFDVRSRAAAPSRAIAGNAETTKRNAAMESILVNVMTSSTFCVASWNGKEHRPCHSEEAQLALLSG